MLSCLCGSRSYSSILYTFTLSAANVQAGGVPALLKSLPSVFCGCYYVQRFYFE